MIRFEDIRTAAAPLACFATMGAVFGAFAAQVPVIKAQIGAADGAFGIALLVASFGAVLAMWLAPRFDQMAGRRALAVLCAVLGAVFLVPSMMASVVTFALGMVLCTCTAGVLDVIMNARISAIEARRARPIMNFAHGVFSLAYGLSAICAGLLREVGWSPVAVFAAIALINVAAVRAALGDREEPLEEDAGQVVPTGQGMLILGGLVILIAFMAEQATEGWSALHLERGLGGGAAEGAMGPAILGLTMAFGRFGGQLLVNRVSEVRVMALASAVSATGAFTAAFAGGLLQAYIGFAILGIGVSVVAPMAFSYVGRNVSNRMRTAAIARISVIGYAGFFMGPPIMGFVSEAYGLGVSFAVMGAALLLVTFVLAPLLAAGRGRVHAG